MSAGSCPFHTPVVVLLPRGLWDDVFHVGKARLETSPYYESGHRSRGERGNWETAYKGVAGEAIVRQFLSVQNREHHHRMGLHVPVKGQGDIIVDGQHYEVKFQYLSSKWFNINQKAHQEDKKNSRGITGYLPVLADNLGDSARIGRIVPYKDVDQWELHDYGYGAPCHRRLVQDLLREYF